MFNSAIGKENKITQYTDIETSGPIVKLKPLVTNTLNKTHLIVALVLLSV